ncbi:MAG: hypothetical protein EBX56_09470, partial [Betaproteobacteria bacterium]|nr:hypothetical protein [Betaproteobacteria bacterium]
MKDQVSEVEWQLRCDLAACYRLVAMFGWDDLVFTHISARVPGADHHFLINPYGMMFDEISASHLVKVDRSGHPVIPAPYPVNPAGFVIHSAIHEARDDVLCVLHTHTTAGVAVAAQAQGLLPISQQASVILPLLAYHDYEGLAPPAASNRSGRVSPCPGLVSAHDGQGGHAAWLCGLAQVKGLRLGASREIT